MRTTVKVEDFKQWVMSQPDEKPVDMYETGSSCRCGCAMVHYGKEVLNLQGGFNVGSYTWNGDEFLAFKDEFPIAKIFDWRRALRVTNYGALKETMIK